MKRKIIGLVVCIAVYMMTWGTIAGTAAAPVSEIVRAKQALVAQHINEYNPAFAHTAEGQAQNDQAEELFAKMVSGLVEEEEAVQQLEEYGLYKLDTEVIEGPSTRSQPSNITLNNTAIMYNGGTGQWWVGGGGYWNSDAAWRAEADPWTGTGNVGGYDGIGVKLYNTSGTYNTRVIESYAYVSDGLGETLWNYNPALADGRQGSFFEYQDKMTINENGYNNRAYLGKHFSCTIKYDSNFTNFNGYARTNYAHTWSSTNITGIGFGAGSSVSFSLSFSSTSNRFTCYSSGEVKF